MVDRKRLEELADEHLALMAADWHTAAKAIRLRHPRPAGETDCFQEAGSWCELSDSYSWVAEPNGDILQIIEAYDAEGNSVSRTRVIRRSGR
jgi:hypothetical protein